MYLIELTQLLHFGVRECDSLPVNNHAHVPQHMVLYCLVALHFKTCCSVGAENNTACFTLCFHRRPFKLSGESTTKA